MVKLVPDLTVNARINNTKVNYSSNPSQINNNPRPLHPIIFNSLFQPFQMQKPHLSRYPSNPNFRPNFNQNTFNNKAFYKQISQSTYIRPTKTSTTQSSNNSSVIWTTLCLLVPLLSSVLIRCPVHFHFSFPTYSAMSITFFFLAYPFVGFSVSQSYSYHTSFHPSLCNS